MKYVNPGTWIKTSSSEQNSSATDAGLPGISTSSGLTSDGEQAGDITLNFSDTLALNDFWQPAKFVSLTSNQPLNDGWNTNRASITLGYNIASASNMSDQLEPTAIVSNHDTLQFQDTTGENFKLTLNLFLTNTEPLGDLSDSEGLRLETLTNLAAGSSLDSTHQLTSSVYLFENIAAFELVGLEIEVTPEILTPTLDPSASASADTLKVLLSGAPSSFPSANRIYKQNEWLYFSNAWGVYKHNVVTGETYFLSPDPWFESRHGFPFAYSYDNNATLYITDVLGERRISIDLSRYEWAILTGAPPDATYQVLVGLYDLSNGDSIVLAIQFQVGVKVKFLYGLCWAIGPLLFDALTATTQAAVESSWTEEYYNYFPYSAQFDYFFYFYSSYDGNIIAFLDDIRPPWGPLSGTILPA